MHTSEIGVQAGYVRAGNSLAGTTLNSLMADGYSVTCGIEIENRTNCSLTMPRAYINGGVLSIPPITIFPETREAMIARKIGYTATGSYGTVSWLIESTDDRERRRLIVMWCAPFDHNLYNNTLAVGITKPGYIEHPIGKKCFASMYDNSHINELIKYGKKEFHRDISPIIYEDSDYQVVATMGSSHKAQVKILFTQK
ncbi:tereporin-Ca1-like [Ruditapes philippinarum]|uniref:tereporin-Ca1-like n=1 Tax=Ruditapes philippinarum TaxID=129788 RepID=UPI00295AC799|nr:tereporin-Ca1-like [Ruditapes philippinarum]